MKKSFIFNFVKEVELNAQGIQKQNHLVIFFPYKDIEKHESDFQIQLRKYFHRNTLPDKLIIVCFEFNKAEVKALFEEGSDIYDYIPKFDYSLDKQAIFVISINKKGEFSSVIGADLSEDEIKEIYNRGLVNIFKNRGGLIIAQPAHHFVFPSGKHCDRFLRTGNVLIHGTEILFIASALIKHFGKKELESIYCDTSSINSLAYAYISLQKELNPNFKKSVAVESFGSYQLFENSEFQANQKSLFLISSSTSGNILERMTNEKNRRKNIKLENTAIIYGLGVERYTEQVVCNLTHSENNPEGFDKFDSYNTNKGEQCRFCNEEGSKPLLVRGDVFLLEKPHVTAHLIKKAHLPKYLNSFAGFYKKPNQAADSLIRCYYKENGTDGNNYEIYIDIGTFFDEWLANRGDKKHYFYPLFVRLNKFINQNVPASIKYMITLPDEASEKLAKCICTLLNEQGIKFEKENILGIQSEELEKIDKEGEGVIAVIGSSIVSGSNLLYLSRALRDFEETYQRIYFLFLSRTANPDHLDFLKSNIGIGEFGPGTHKIFIVDKIHCSDESEITPWHVEEEFINIFQEYLEDIDGYESVLEYCQERTEVLAVSGKHQGLSNNLFFPTLSNKALKIRPGFAFAPYSKGKAHSDFITRSKQAEIYFIISSILNDMRNNGIFHQGEYVRNLIDPGNFVRFNDGIIQASLLRAAKNEELDYRLSEELSTQMKSVLGDMIVHIHDDHAEALNEFFYAIAIKKLRLVRGDLLDCIELLEEQEFYKKSDSILKGLVHYIKEEVLKKTLASEKFKKLPLVEVDEE